MSEKRMLRKIFFAMILSLSLLIPPSVCSAQGARRAGKRKSPRPETLLTAERLSVLADSKSPIVVFPGGRGFETLQAAIDYANAPRNTGGKPGQRSTIFLQPGTHLTGNYTINLNTDMIIVGIGGCDAVEIEGQFGNNQPTLTVSKTGSFYHEIELTGVSLLNAVAPALEFSGNGASVVLDVSECFLETGLSGSPPAIRMTGGGANSSDTMQLNISYSEIEADSSGATGPAIDANITSFAEIDFLDCDLDSNGVCIDVDVQTPGTVDLRVIDSRIEGDVGGALNGIVANNVGNLYLSRSTIYSSQDAVLVTDTNYAEIQHCTLNASQGYGIKALTGTTGSSVYVAFTGFLSPNTIFTDPGSTTKACLNHFNFKAF